MLSGLIAGGITGAFLGLLGGGGSIVAVPALVYILGLSAKAAIGTSLVVVGAASLLAAWNYYLNRSVVVPLAISFGFSGVAGSLVGSKIAQLIPDSIQLYMFAATMAIVALLLMKPQHAQEEVSDGRESANWPVLAIGVAAGILTGILGVGGGFIIVPVLVLSLRLPLLKAVGTSLLIIGLNSIAGSISYLPYLQLDFSIAVFAVATLVFSVLGARLASVIPQERLRGAFAFSLICVSIFMFVKQY